MSSKWKEIWEKRTDNFDNIDMSDPKAVFLELKRIDGFDVVGDGIGYDALIKQNADILTNLTRNGKTVKSIFDVGCGCGANLYLFRREGLEIGGIDYSSALVGIANKLFNDSEIELLCGEAIDIPTDRKYDALMSNSVFSYFPDEEYTRKVLDKMLDKTNNSIGLVDVHDVTKKEAFVEFRRRTVENYDERYKELNKLFYSKDFFSDWAKSNDVDIRFVDSDVEGYWNKDFVFDVYFYKR